MDVVLAAGVVDREEWKGGKVGREENTGVKRYREIFQRIIFRGSCRCQGECHFLRLASCFSLAKPDLLCYQSVRLCFVNAVTQCPASMVNVLYTLCGNATMKNCNKCCISLLGVS